MIRQYFARARLPVKNIEHPKKFCYVMSPGSFDKIFSGQPRRKIPCFLQIRRGHFEMKVGASGNGRASGRASGPSGHVRETFYAPICPVNKGAFCGCLNLNTLRMLTKKDIAL